MNNQVKNSLLQLCCAEMICNAMTEFVYDITMRISIFMEHFSSATWHGKLTLFIPSNSDLCLPWPCPTWNTFAVGLIVMTHFPKISKIQPLWNHSIGTFAAPYGFFMMCLLLVTSLFLTVTYWTKNNNNNNNKLKKKRKQWMNLFIYTLLFSFTVVISILFFNLHLHSVCSDSSALANDAKPDLRLASSHLIVWTAITTNCRCVALLN